VVTHAGVGTILTALQLGTRPVVVPRLHAFAEAVDDHQVALARRLDSAGLVTLVEELDHLADAVASPGTPNGHTGASGSLVSELHDYLAQSVGRPPRAAVPSRV
jgi:UDP-N-acetylglucosamine transferase subunit ALG13